VPTSLFCRSGQLACEILPGLGGRLGSFTFAGRELLSGPEANPDNWGATYWTSPQADWGWPPVPEVDSAPYSQQEAAEEEIVLLGPEARIGERHFRIEKRFRPAPRDCIDTEYRIENLGAAPIRLASWEISRVPPGGLTFFPSGERVQTPVAPHAELLFEEWQGASFYDHAQFRTGLSRKVHADGREGFLAHVLSGGETGDLLLLKLFADSPPERQAPGEGEIEVFSNFDGRYVEIEVQGPYETIDPGRASSLVIRTAAIPIPSRLRGDRGALLELARSSAAQLR